MSTVHPRVGGEHLPVIPLERIVDGSSPRGRGTLRRALGRGLPWRFIPAWAGNTFRVPVWSYITTVHPRVGGEHQQCAKCHRQTSGSSPRGRGTPSSLTPAAIIGRFIPAWAGNTDTEQRPRLTGPVHPRVGGEHVWIASAGAIQVGSSPRGRGTLGSECPLVPSHRFIPAWAGNTSSCVRFRSLRTVHPRVGGEHKYRTMATEESTGSSPRGRGTPVAGWKPSPGHRFIPAWAGNTTRQASANTCVPVHPRVGGEHLAVVELCDLRYGSSPRGRGTPERFHIALEFRRFIPAWAGNTSGFR